MYHILATYIINNIGIITFIHKYYIDIHYILSVNYQFNKNFVKPVLINYLTQLIIYIYHLQFIIKNNLFYLYQPFHHCISFKFVLIVWHHCGEL